MEVRVDGVLSPYCSAKDVILAIIGKIGTAGGTGYVIEYTGSAIRMLSMEGRMTCATCRSKPARARAWLRRTKKTIAYIKGRPMAQRGIHSNMPCEPGSAQDGCKRHLRRDGHSESRRYCSASELGPSPGMVNGVDQRVPDRGR